MEGGWTLLRLSCCRVTYTNTWKVGGHRFWPSCCRVP
jgi:hypothetical protein